MNFCGITLPDKPIFLAPMEDVTDSTFRYICKSIGGVDVMFTEFVSADGILHNGKKSLNKLNIFNYERPIGIQIYGHTAESMVEAALLVEHAKPDFIDINFGCPVKKIANRGAGSGILRDIPLMLEITRKVVEAVKLPVTVKTRLGWDENSKNIEEIAEKLQDVGILALTIHARTRAQMFTGKADWTLIGKVKNNPRIKIPIIGNGDIDSPEKAKEMFDNYGVDAIMLGRATIGKPWIFNHTRHYFNTGELLPEPTLAQKIEMAKHHLSQSVIDKGEFGGIMTMRRHFVQYLKSLPHSKEMRLKLLTSKSVQEIIEILDLLIQKYSFQ